MRENGDGRVDDATLLRDLRKASEVAGQRARTDRDVFLAGVSGLLRVAADRIERRHE